MDSVPVFIIAVAALAGLGSLAGAAYVYSRGQRAKSWPLVMGQVTRSGITTSESKDNEGNVSVSYLPDVEYRYSVQGTVHTGTRIAVGPVSGRSEQVARQIAGRYPVNGTVAVHYDPQQPGYAVLEAGAPPLTLIIFACGALFALSLAFFTYFNFARS